MRVASRRMLPDDRGRGLPAYHRADAMSDTTGADPERPIPGPPEPWHGAEQPVDRGGPPWFMTEMIAAEPAFAARCLTRLVTEGPGGGAARLAAALREAAAAGAPVTVVGCGTSEHGALGAAETLRDAWRRAGLPGHGPVAAQAFEASLEPRDGLCIAVSHDGGTWATTEALEAARAAGARTALITVSARAPGAQGVDIVVETLERDTSYCHTLGYVSPLVAAYAVGQILAGDSPGPEHAVAIRSLLAAGLTPDATAAAEAMAAELAGRRPILTVASGADRTAARELVLKLEEGTWIPSASRNLETLLHGHLPSTDPRTGLVLIMTDRRARAERVARARQALEAAGVIGIRVGAILSADVAAELDPSLTPIGRIVIPEAPGLPAPVAALLGTATPLQLLVERLARVVGTNPDPIRRDDPVYAAAMSRVEG
jgi:fructoselysine-6-P-deglycase FrlB-like protein